jgi:hypothetical protein
MNGSGMNGSGMNGSGMNGSGMNGSGMNGSGTSGSGPSGSGLSGPGPSSRRTDDGAGAGDYKSAAVEQQTRPSRRQVWDGCPMMPNFTSVVPWHL